MKIINKKNKYPLYTHRTDLHICEKTEALRSIDWTVDTDQGYKYTYFIGLEMSSICSTFHDKIDNFVQ